jgi:3-dehydroquinate dehydratase/shikimate dehydrogenase
MLVLGAGGAARAIVAEAKRRGAEVIVSNRTPKRANELASDLGVSAVPRKKIRHLQFEILVNATPVGMVPAIDASPVSQELLQGKIVFDAVYNPPLTKLLREAAEVGATIIPGTEMYINQAARQSELYTGTRPGLKMMKRLLGLETE